MTTRDKFIAAVEATPEWKQCPQSLRGTFKRLVHIAPVGHPPKQRLYRVKCNPLAVRIERQIELADGSKTWVNTKSEYYGKIKSVDGQFSIGGFTFGQKEDLGI